MTAELRKFRHLVGRIRQPFSGLGIVVGTAGQHPPTTYVFHQTPLGTSILGLALLAVAIIGISWLVLLTTARHSFSAGDNVIGLHVAKSAEAGRSTRKRNGGSHRVLHLKPGRREGA